MAKHVYPPWHKRAQQGFFIVGAILVIVLPTYYGLHKKTFKPNTLYAVLGSFLGLWVIFSIIVRFVLPSYAPESTLPEYNPRPPIAPKAPLHPSAKPAASALKNHNNLQHSESSLVSLSSTASLFQQQQQQQQDPTTTTLENPSSHLLSIPPSRPARPTTPNLPSTVQIPAQTPVGSVTAAQVLSEPTNQQPSSSSSTRRMVGFGGGEQDEQQQHSSSNHTHHFVSAPLPLSTFAPSSASSSSASLTATAGGGGSGSVSFKKNRPLSEEEKYPSFAEYRQAQHGDLSKRFQKQNSASSFHSLRNQPPTAYPQNPQQQQQQQQLYSMPVSLPSTPPYSSSQQAD